MMNGEVTPEELSHYDDDYESAEAPEGFGNVPDGQYQIKVDRAFLKHSQNGNPMLSWELEILVGQYAGRKIFKNNMLMSQENFGFLKADLDVCGVTLKKLSDLPNRLEDLIDTQLEIKKVTKGEFKNVYFQRMIETSASGMNRKPSGGGYKANDDLPF